MQLQLNLHAEVVNCWRMTSKHLHEHDTMSRYLDGSTTCLSGSGYHPYLPWFSLSPIITFLSCVGASCI
jgi:hypothetical protein